ncbi:MAG: tricorn protease [Melioribacteraceae bacterium]|nr:MAG: tricorn protease [Melioribacteraceae bacterium]
MFKKIGLILLLTTFSLSAGTAFFVKDPTVSPDAQKIVFSYEGDLWIVASEGGTAFRLTAMQGEEDNPSFSPDGKYIAFSGRQEGNSNVYVMPVNGGEIKQLTYNYANDIVECWSWDSKHVYFVSNRYNRMSPYKVAASGGTPERLFDHYFILMHNLAFAPDDQTVYFNETWESSLFANRKRYKGDFNPDIKSLNLKTLEYNQLTDYRGKDFFPITDKNGNLYFLSDEANEEFNLYKWENGSKKGLTEFTSSIYSPSISADGSLIAFIKDYELFTYNTSTGKSNKVNVNIYDNYTLNIENSYSVSGKITSFDVSPDNKKIVYVSRGEMFVSDIEGKFSRKIETNPVERVLEVLWLEDNKTVIYNRTDMGYLNLFTISVDKISEEKRITSGEKNSQDIIMNNKRTKAVFFSGRNELNVIDLTNFDVETVVEDEFWSLYTTSAYFSPDDKYLLYTAYRYFEQDIRVYSFDEKKSFNITKTGVTETNPVWSPDGKYIYFQSDRTSPNYPRGNSDTEIYRIALRNFGPEFKSDKLAEVFVEEKDTTEKKIETIIDFEGLNDRWEGIATQPGNQYAPTVITDKEKTYVLFTSNHDNEGYAVWKTTLEPFEKNKTEKISGLTTSWLYLVKSKEKYYTLASGNIYEVKLSQNKAEKIDVSYEFTRNMKNEFSQMFYETWANLEENFYADDFHGVNWKQMRDKYAGFLPKVKTRANLRQLLSDLLGELNSSHQGFTSNGDEEKTFYNSESASTGLLFENERPYVIKRIVKDSPADNVDVDLKPGDIIISVNDVKVDPALNRESYFVFPDRPEEIKLVVSRDGKEKTAKIKPVSRSSFDVNLYDEWVDFNQEYVDKHSDSRIAYVHMKNMGGGELANFRNEMINEAFYKDALILDLRNNRGGNVHDDVLQFLSQKPYTKWKYRDGEFAPQPNFAPASKPIILLINEQSLSDAEMTAAGFKELGLGTIVGTETYRWLIFTSGKSLVDGSFYRLPSWGCYTLDGKNIEEHGVAPDIYIKKVITDKINGTDPQLDKAIELIKADSRF